MFYSETNKMDGYLVAGIGIAVPACISYLFYRKRSQYSTILEEVKLYQINEDLSELAKSESIPYGAVSGYVKSNVEPFILKDSVYESRGVILKTTVTEHKSEWKKGSDSWTDVTNTVNHSTKTVPFSLEDKEGKNKITVSQPLRAEGLTYSSISSRFDPTTSSFSTNIYSLASGEKIKGYETREDMLLEGTNLTGIGQIQYSDGEVKLCPPGNSFRYILSTSSLSSIIDSERTFSRFLKWLSIFFAIGSCLCLSYWMYRKLQAWYLTQQQNREFERLAAENEPENECVICLHRPKNVVFLDCGHICSCIQCSNKLSECPVCRSHIVRVVPTFDS